MLHIWSKKLAKSYIFLTLGRLSARVTILDGPSSIWRCYPFLTSAFFNTFIRFVSCYFRKFLIFQFPLFFCSKWWNSMGNFLINKLDISTDPEIRTEHSLRNARNVISSRILKVLLRLRRCSALFSKRQRLPRTLRNYSKETRKKYDIRQFKTSSEKDIVLFHDNYLLWLLPGSWTLLILTWIIFQSIFIIYTLPPV